MLWDGNQPENKLKKENEKSFLDITSSVNHSTKVFSSLKVIQYFLYLIRFAYSE